MTRELLRSGILAAAALCCSQSASAFECLSETVLERFNRADVVFEGIIVNASSATQAINQQTPQKRFEILVTEPYKGETEKVQILWADDWGYKNANNFPRATRAVFFAMHGSEAERLVTNPCLAVVYDEYEDGYRPMKASEFWLELGKFEID